MSHKRRIEHDYRHPYKRPRSENGISQQNHSPMKKPTFALPPLPNLIENLERQVFTHPSLGGDGAKPGSTQSYDRLEFLGDAYIEVMATRLIWETYKNLSTGRMSQIRELLVKNETLSEFAIMYGLDKRLRVAATGRPQSGHDQRKLNGDVFEAYVAATILSDPVRGFETAEDWMTQLWTHKLKEVKDTSTDKKSKEELAKKIMSKGIKINYVDERPHIQKTGQGVETYFIGVYLTGWGYENQHLGSGKGLSKQAAGMQAAANALENKPLINIIAATKVEYDAKKREEEQALDVS